MKYRILRVTNGFGAKYFAQKKFLFMWWYCTSSGRDTIDVAMSDIEFEKKFMSRSKYEVIAEFK